MGAIRAPKSHARRGLCALFLFVALASSGTAIAQANPQQTEQGDGDAQKNVGDETSADRSGQNKAAGKKEEGDKDAEGDSTEEVLEEVQAPEEETEIPMPPAPKEAPPKEIPLDDIPSLREEKRTPKVTSIAGAMREKDGRLIDLPSEEDLATRLAARAEYVRSGDETAADDELAVVEEIRFSLNARNVIVGSAALIREARQAKEAGAFARAVQLADSAAKLSPDLQAAHWMRILAYASHDWTQFARIFDASVDLLESKTGSFRNVVTLLANLILFLAFSVMGTMVVYALIQALKYFRYAAHDLAERAPSFVKGRDTLVLLVVLLFVPVVLQLGWAVLILFALLVTIAYQSSRERILSGLMVAILAGAPWIIYFATPILGFPGTVADSMVTVMSEAFSQEEEQRLESETHRKDKRFVDSALILAFRSRMRGDLKKAESQYQRALEVDRGNVLARNNLGVVQYLMGQPEPAEASFRQAVRAKRLAEPMINLASIILEAGDFQEANTLLDGARRINAEIAERYDKKSNSTATKRKLVDARLTDDFLWRRLLDLPEEKRKAIVGQVWRVIGKKVPTLAMPIMALVFLFVSVFLVRRSAKLSTTCVKCGSPAPRTREQICVQCESVFHSTSAVESRVREEKEVEIRRYHRRYKFIERVLSFFAGAGDVFSEQPLSGVLIVFLVFLSFSGIHWTDGFIAHPWEIWIDSTATVLKSALSALVLLVLSFFSVKRGFER